MREIEINEWMSFEDIIKQCEKNFRASNYIETILIPYLEQLGFSQNDKNNIIKYSINEININADHYINNVKKIKQLDNVYASYEIFPEKFINGYFLKKILEMPIYKKYIVSTKTNVLQYPDRLSLLYKNETSILCLYNKKNNIYILKEINFNFKQGTNFIITLNKYINMTNKELEEQSYKYCTDEE